MRYIGKRTGAFVTAFCLALTICGSITPLPASAAEYSYEVIPLLSPINQYFFVKTDNPDPYSFRFADKSSVYGEDASLTPVDLDTLFADVTYEDAETGRVKGGYLFEGNNTDGGELVLQEVTRYDYWGDPAEWQDTSVQTTLPTLLDTIDYLISTYAKGDSFFDRMDAVQSGLESICFYSGSYVRGEVYRAAPFWSLSNSPHIDQSLYIQGPYNRKSSQPLLSSVLYPFRYDSLGFPSAMSRVATRLDSSATYQWNEGAHYLIDVTYNGETHSYGGQGEGEGQGLSEDKIQKVFTFDEAEPLPTFEELRTLLQAYSAIEMPDDFPHEDDLTLSMVCDKVADGAWAKITGIASVFGGTYDCYAFLYKEDDKNEFYTDPLSNGGLLYWGGSLGYASDMWVDGRYVNQYEAYQPNATFAEHADRPILLTHTAVPEIDYDLSYEYQSGTYVYTNVTVTEGVGTLLYYYQAEENTWKASGYSVAAELAEKGLLDKKYADQLQLTYDEVMALHVDQNTAIPPTVGYLYDGTAQPGIRFAADHGVMVQGDAIPQDALLQTEQTESGWRITLTKDGTEVEPDGLMTVKLPMSEGMSGKTVSVYRLDADGDRTDMGAKEESGYLVFSTDRSGEYLVETITLGDLDKDGNVTVTDALTILRMAVGLEASSNLADLDGSGEVTVADALQALRIAVGLA